VTILSGGPAYVTLSSVTPAGCLAQSYVYFVPSVPNGSMISLGAIAMQPNGPPVTIASPLPNDTITGCSAPAGVTAVVAGAAGAQTVSFTPSAAAQAGIAGCSTAGLKTIEIPMIETLADGINFITTTQTGPGTYQLTISGFGFGDGGNFYFNGDTYAPNWSLTQLEVGIGAPDGVCGSYPFAIYPDNLFDDDDPDGSGPEQLEGSLELCPDVAAPLPSLQILSTTSDGRTTTNVTNTNQSVLVGQYVDLTAVVMNGTGTPTFQWSQPPGNTGINWRAADDQSQGPAPIDPSSLHGRELIFAWTDTSANSQCAQPGQCVQVTATIPGSPPLSAGVQYNITTPQLMPVVQQFGTVIPVPPMTCPNQTVLAMCNYDPTANAPVGISFEASSPGNNLIEWLQIVNSGSRWDYYGPSGKQCESDTSGRDGPGPLTFLDGPDLGDAGDSPSVPLQNGDQLITAAFSFSTFFMFRPTTNDMFAPLYRIDWSWSAQAQPSANSPTGWQLSSTTPCDPKPAVVRVVDNVPAGQPSAYPKWNGNANPLAPCETVTAPATPSGAASGLVGTSYTYTTYTAGGSTSSLGNPVQYQFIWGDGTASPWLTVGTASASHSWNGAGTYAVTAQARSAPNPLLLSPMSAALVVTIQ